MANRISVTVTVGEGSEKHNHDVEYRKTLDHIKTDEQAQVLELIPYKPYNEQINDLMKPYIDEYNEKQKQRYQEAWNRFNNGQIKTKPRKSNYKPMDYDYYSAHKDDVYYNQKDNKTEPLPIFRSIIVGLGDKSDKDNGIISREQAEKVMQNIVDKWERLFPNLKLLGATLHYEDGFWHAHFDYKPLSEVDKSQLKQEQGLSVSISQEKAFETMGIEPEQSIINERDKAPIRFNGFRNKLYYAIEEELHKNNLRMIYNATKEKEPDKDSSKNQDLNSWQEHRDAVDRLQELKNKVCDIFEEGDKTLNGLNEFIRTEEEIQKTLRTIENQPRSRINKNNVVVSFKLFDQFKSFLNNLLDSIAIFAKQLSDMEQSVNANLKYAKEMESRNDAQANLIKSLNAENNSLRRQAQDNKERREYMQSISFSNGKTAEEVFQAERKTHKQRQRNDEDIDLSFL